MPLGADAGPDVTGRLLLGLQTSKVRRSLELMIVFSQLGCAEVELPSIVSG